jgi:putative NADH-flavin reductase
MNVVLIGASGMIGSRVLKELVSRGHKVKAVVRDPSKVAAGAGVSVVPCDVTDLAALTGVLGGAHAVISALQSAAGRRAAVGGDTRGLLVAAKQAGVRRVIIVGGAGSLFVKAGVTLLDSGHVPEAWQAIARAHSALLEELRGTKVAASLDWTYFSPAAFIEPGERTGTFRLWKDDLVVDGHAQSRISAEDYAIALVDELEQPRYERERFTAGY